MSTIPAYLSEDRHAGRYFDPIVQWSRNNHPFYKSRLADDAAEVPLLSRQDILADNEGFLNGHPETARTSGSTGVPVRISWSARRKRIEHRARQQCLKWVGGIPQATSFVHLGEEDRGRSDRILSIRLPLDEQIAILKRRYGERADTGLTTYPTNAQALAELVLEEGHDMRFITCVGVYAEAFEPHQEDIIREAFPNARIWSVYSSMELGMVAGRCPRDRDHYHVMTRKLGLEILNERNEPARLGELGRIVMTDYFNVRTPLIRYDIGDMAAPSVCPCGITHLPAITSLIGKVRGALKHRDGRRMPFASLSVAIMDIPGVRQYQVVQHELERFEVRVVRDDDAMGDEAFGTALDRAFEQEFGYRPRIDITRERQIERGLNGKFYASISHVP